MNDMSRWFWMLPRQMAVTRSGTGQSPGCCERCGGYGMICLNGQRFLCWEHYCDETRASLTAAERQPK